MRNNGNELPTGKSVKEMGLREDTPLTVDIFKIHITVHCYHGQKKVDLEVEPSTKAGHLKKHFESLCRIAADNQNLSKEDTLIEDDGISLDDVDIQANEVLNLEPIL
jgi:hypothetical protein